MTGIIAHRGLWLTPEEKNTRAALARAFDRGFGVETDLRDCMGEIVISHNMPTGGEMTFAELLRLLDGRDLTLALNIKADGMAEPVLDLLRKYRHSNYFTFDMSLPDARCQLQLGLRCFTGLSDLLPQPPLFEHAAGVWLDCFDSDWYDAAVINGLLQQGKQVCAVSPDLHQRPYKKLWEKCRAVASSGFMLCTDHPQEAEEFFNGQN